MRLSDLSPEAAEDLFLEQINLDLNLVAVEMKETTDEAEKRACRALLDALNLVKRYHEVPNG